MQIRKQSRTEQILPSAASRMKVVDFFSGCGGTSAGFRAAGATILLGIDNDEIACATYARNFPTASVLHRDVRALRPDDIEKYLILDRADKLVFSACAPCQPFSQQRREQTDVDPRASLLFVFLKFVKRWMPDYIFLENVPGVRGMAVGNRTYDSFIRSVRELGYSTNMEVVRACDYGVPQVRSRLVVLASKNLPVSFPAPTHGSKADQKYVSVWDCIANLPKIGAGKKHQTIPNHESAAISPLNLERIKATPPGGSRSDWPRYLELRCHTNGHTGHSDVYGRLRKHRPAPAITTRFLSISTGRYGHPIQHRAISVREAARLQTFEDSFIFEGSLHEAARQVGNAVPVLLAESFAKRLIEHDLKL